MACDSCGAEARDTAAMFRPDTRYDHGWAHGIGPCCVPAFERAGYAVKEFPESIPRPVPDPDPWPDAGFDFRVREAG